MPSVCSVSQAELQGSVLTAAQERVKMQKQASVLVSEGPLSRRRHVGQLTSSHTCPAVAWFFKSASWNRAGGWYDSLQSGVPGRARSTRPPGPHGAAPSRGVTGQDSPCSSQSCLHSGGAYGSHSTVWAGFPGAICSVSNITNGQQSGAASHKMTFAFPFKK